MPDRDRATADPGDTVPSHRRRNTPPPDVAATHTDLAALEDRIGKRMDDQLETIKTLLEPLTQGNKLSEACIKLGFETLQMALQPGVLTRLILLATIVVGGAPVSMAVAQAYLPHVGAPAVQINSNNTASDAAIP